MGRQETAMVADFKQTEAAHVTSTSANPGYSYGFNLQTLYDNQLR